MTLQEFIGVIENSDMLRIIKDGKDIFVNYRASLRYEDLGIFESVKREEVKKFRAVPEIRHREWKERNLMPPLSPDETPDYSFSDLQMKLYYTIYI